jgi:hypothetical protein
MFREKKIIIQSSNLQSSETLKFALSLLKFTFKSVI